MMQLFYGYYNSYNCAVVHDDEFHYISSCFQIDFKSKTSDNTLTTSERIFGNMWSRLLVQVIVILNS